MAWTKKIIEAHITLTADSFGGKGVQKIIRGLPVAVQVKKTGGAEKPSCLLSVSGMTYSDMEQLTTLAFRPLQTRKNLLAVFAGDQESGLSRIFAGEIVTASADFNAAPDPVFDIEALTAYYPALMATGPLAIKGDAPAADIIKQQAALVGYQFENQGVTTRLRNCILNGDPITKAKAAAKQAGATLLLEDAKMTLLPAGKAKKGKAVKVSATSGLIGYPTFTADGIEFEALFDPAFELDGLVQVQSIVPKASGVWRITALNHHLSANMPDGGPWKTKISAVYVDAEVKA